MKGRALDDLSLLTEDDEINPRPGLSRIERSCQSMPCFQPESRLYEILNRVFHKVENFSMLHIPGEVKT